MPKEVEPQPAAGHGVSVSVQSVGCGLDVQLV